MSSLLFAPHSEVWVNSAFDLAESSCNWIFQQTRFLGTVNVLHYIRSKVNVRC